MLVEDFRGAAFLEGAVDLEPFVVAATVDLVAFRSGAAGAWLATSELEISSVMTRVETTAYTPQDGDSPGRIVRCGSEQRNRTCGEEKGSEYKAPD
jgi:hypothetical protein